MDIEKETPLTETETKLARKAARRRLPRFDLIAGNVCLDFVNTLDDRYLKPKELLETYADLLRFGEDSGVLDARQADRLYERNSVISPVRSRFCYGGGSCARQFTRFFLRSFTGSRCRRLLSPD